MGFAIDRRTAAWGAQYQERGLLARRTRRGAARLRRLVRAPRNRAATERLRGRRAGAGLGMEPLSRSDQRLSQRGRARAGLRRRQHGLRRGLHGGELAAPAGYGALIAASFPVGVDLRLAAPVERIALPSGSVALTTPLGEVRASAVLVTVSTAVLASGAIELPPELEPWRLAAEKLPLGRNEKLFFEIAGDAGGFAPESHVHGNPRDARAGSYYIRPFGRPVIECFLGGAGAEIVRRRVSVAGFAHATTSLRRCSAATSAGRSGRSPARTGRGPAGSAAATATPCRAAAARARIWPARSTAESSSPARRPTLTTSRPPTARMTAASAPPRRSSRR